MQSPADSLAIAVAGAGAIGRKHIVALGTSRAARLGAIVDPSDDAAELAASLGVPYHKGLADLTGVAGVVLATPTALHLQQGLECVAMGLPALIEKPVTASAPDALVLADAAEAAGVPMLVGHHRRHNPRIARARELVQSGAIGRVVAVQASVMLCKPDDYFAPEWRRQPGAGPVLTNLIHDIDFLRHIVGEIADVQAVQSNALRGFAVEDTAAAILRFENGALGTVTVSDTAAAPWSWELTSAENPDYPPTGQSCTWISGTHGALELPSLRMWRHQDGPRGWFTPLGAHEADVQDADPLLLQIDHFAAVIRGEAAPLVSLRDAARSVAVVDAIRRAAGTAGRETIMEREIQ
ncbi:Predicted dehydrogenase [Paracoccus halophilus]|uniref:Oxidoreductase n=1 Tax=Paracoccus halophilus TaxID=376733 RepID=A0A099EX89_9RHOB|nr:Gfo/Idh/MocA family oxidoreductase [Paracoccus halophilus]KGJ02859.1 oxidoreductase [Paracoccus halophilus]SFA60150.1 Predicted dehydrogenase [Paracoccus halophilus]